VSLPKGGGAIKAIGEKFAANPVTGTGTLSVPIAVTPGRAGFQPDLALAYDSGAGNGPFGLGWAVGIPSVRRKTDKGLPLYRDGRRGGPEDSDVFVLSDAEDLVPLRNDQGHEASLSDVEEDGITYRRRRYRPRIEGAFARIERWTNTADGMAHWRTTSADNVRRVYGLSAACRIADPTDASRVFEWLLEEARDERGNLIRYEYKEEDRASAPNTVYEETRTRANQQPTNRYPKRIYYGNKVAEPTQDTDWSFQVVFDYGEHNTAEPTQTEEQTWSTREDPFSNYRSGFEIRCYRLCCRVLMFHQFADLNGGTWTVVRSTDLDHTPSPVATKLSSVTQRGWMLEDTTWTTEELPPLEFEYSEAEIEHRTRVLREQGGPTIGIDPQKTHWIDLNGEGLPGLLTRYNEIAWYYRRSEGNGEMGRRRRCNSRPLPPHVNHQFMDLEGDGKLDLVRFGHPEVGYQERDDDGEWKAFRPFKSIPRINWRDPNMRLIDLTGDGHADILMTDQGVYTWYPSKEKDGFDRHRKTYQSLDEKQAPTLVFASDAESIFLADMTGDGLTDLVRIRAGEVAYWPNKGYGRFGGKVTMANVPHMGINFDPRRVLLADVDGSGPTDLIYNGPTAPIIYVNQSGNEFAEQGILIRSFPGVHSGVDIRTADVMGRGTACLVWASPLPADQMLRVRYVDLMAQGKPHLLTKITNNLGGEIRLSYEPSTSYYLADRRAGNPWATKLPFPVHCLDKVTTIDHVTGRRFVSRYAYHHGYFDGPEREFRGFGMVEQWDSESFSDYENEDPNDDQLAHFVPPVHTKTWFHTGAWRKGPTLETAYASEYYSEDSTSFLLSDAKLPSGLSALDAREAVRALKGKMLRQEVYSDDDSDDEHRPYTVVEQSYELLPLQPRAGDGHASFLTVPSETVTWNYERKWDATNGADPSVQHDLTLVANEYGQIERAAKVRYPRRSDFLDPNLPEQTFTPVIVSENTFINQVDQTDYYHLGVPQEQKVWEVTGPDLVRTDDTPFTAADLNQLLDGNSPIPEIPYDQEPDDENTNEKRLISIIRARYWGDAADIDGNLTTGLPFGDLESRALVYERTRLTYSAGLLTASDGFDNRVTSTMLQDEGAYTDVDSDGNWWSTSGQQTLNVQHFCQHQTHTDPFGNVTDVTWDDDDLAITEIVSPEPFAASPPIRNTVTADIDYRLLQPWKVTGPNGNVNAAAFDALGRVIATAVMGREGEGDTLEDPTTEITYELDRWMGSPQRPNRVYTRTREEHGPSSPETRWLETYVYSDGSGNEAMTKALAEPGLAYYVDGQGQLQQTQADPRWVGTGRTVLDNKGNPVKQYEPYFSITEEYDDEDELVLWGVTPVMHYDSLGRNIRTDLPNGTFRKVDFDAWQQTTYDENDTVMDSDWFAERQPGHSPPASSAEQRAATITEAHYDTPTVAHLDPLGQVFLTVEDPGPSNSPHVLYETRLILDIQGNPRVVKDARGNDAQVQTFDLLQRPVYTHSADGGDRRTLVDVSGQPAREWRSEDLDTRREYDGMRRPTHLWVQSGVDPERLAERTVYGESLSEVDALAGNLYGQVYRIYDGAGLRSNEAYDFKGNLQEHSRRTLVEVDEEVDWTAIATSNDAYDIETAAESSLVDETLTIQSAFDALNRVVSKTTPDDSETRNGYNEAGLLETVDVDVRNEGTWTPSVVGISYNAKGQRESIERGNGTTTAYEYEPETFRLSRLVTTRSSDGAVLQDLNYTYDPVGNITEITDDAQQTVYLQNQIVSPSSKYEYDALYRLIKAEGREHASLSQLDATDFTPASGIPHANDANAFRTYTEDYVYDEVGNFVEHHHTYTGGGWTRYYQIAQDSNRLVATSLPGDDPQGPYSATYDHDDRGNMIEMPHLGNTPSSPDLPGLVYDYRDQIRWVDLNNGEEAIYHYDSAGQRVRKVVRRNSFTEERIYLDGYEVYRKTIGASLDLERETLHVIDGNHRVVMIETKTWENGSEITSPTPLYRYQLDNHLGTACVELDDQGAVITYEEFHPYGTTSWRARSSTTEVSDKRYRYTGKEKDEETGLYYHGARYLACWLGRWTSTDPIGLRDGVNLYAYARGNPINLQDPNGLEGQPGLWTSDEVLAQAVATSFNEQLETAGFSNRANVVTNDGVSSIQFDPSGELPEWASAIGRLGEAGVSLELKAIDPETDRVIPGKSSAGGPETLAEAYGKDTLLDRVKPAAPTGPGEADLMLDPVTEVAPALTVPSVGLQRHAAAVVTEEAMEDYTTRYDRSAGHPKPDIAKQQVQQVADWFETKGGTGRRSTPGEGLSATIFLNASLKEGPVTYQGESSGIGEVVAHEVTEHVLSWALLPKDRSAPLYDNRPASGESLFGANVLMHIKAEESLLAAYASLRTTEGHGSLLYSRFGWQR